MVNMFITWLLAPHTTDERATLFRANAVHERRSRATFAWPMKFDTPLSPLLHFLRVTALRLELDEFFGNLVVGSLRQDTKYRPTGFIQVDALGKW